MVEKDRTKNKSSYRTLPLIPKIEELLLNEKEKQEANKKIFGNGYKDVITRKNKRRNPNMVGSFLCINNRNVCK